VKSFYLAFVLDLEHACPVVISCQEGGVDIEEVAERDPHLIHRQLVDIHNGLGATKAREIAEFLGFSNKAINVATEEIRRLYKIFIERDAVLLEINPFAEIHDGTGERESIQSNTPGYKVFLSGLPVDNCFKSG
jgi:succinyl-CoA synthetase beta subunit